GSASDSPAARVRAALRLARPKSSTPSSAMIRAAAAAMRARMLIACLLFLRLIGRLAANSLRGGSHRMPPLPVSAHLHILGICGTFMGGIAAIAKAAGYRVTGCDANVYPVTR